MSAPVWTQAEKQRLSVALHDFGSIADVKERFRLIREAVGGSKTGRECAEYCRSNAAELATIWEVLQAEKVVAEEEKKEETRKKEAKEREKKLAEETRLQAEKDRERNAEKAKRREEEEKRKAEKIKKAEEDRVKKEKERIEREKKESEARLLKAKADKEALEQAKIQARIQAARAKEMQRLGKKEAAKRMKEEEREREAAIALSAMAAATQVANASSSSSTSRPVQQQVDSDAEEQLSSSIGSTPRTGSLHSGGQINTAAASSQRARAAMEAERERIERAQLGLHGGDDFADRVGQMTFGLKGNLKKTESEGVSGASDAALRDLIRGPATTGMTGTAATTASSSSNGGVGGFGDLEDVFEGRQLYMKDQANSAAVTVVGGSNTGKNAKKKKGSASQKLVIEGPSVKSTGTNLFMPTTRSGGQRYTEEDEGWDTAPSESEGYRPASTTIDMATPNSQPKTSLTSKPTSLTSTSSKPKSKPSNPKPVPVSSDSDSDTDITNPECHLCVNAYYEASNRFWCHFPCGHWKVCACCALKHRTFMKRKDKGPNSFQANSSQGNDNNSQGDDEVPHSCPLCMREAKHIVLSTRPGKIDFEREYKIREEADGEPFSLNSNLRWHGDLGVFVEVLKNEEWVAVEKFRSMISFSRCPIPGCSWTGQKNDKTELALHLKKNHSQAATKSGGTRDSQFTICHLCVSVENEFPMFQERLHTKAEYDLHMKTKHKQCHFCGDDPKRRPEDSGYFYGTAEIQKHLREKHEKCFQCEKDGKTDEIWFDNYDTLWWHFSERHFVCQEKKCWHARWNNLFGCKYDLDMHNYQTHGARKPQEPTPLLQDPAPAGSRNANQAISSRAAMEFPDLGASVHGTGGGVGASSSSAGASSRAGASSSSNTVGNRSVGNRSAAPAYSNRNPAFPPLSSADARRAAEEFPTLGAATAGSSTTGAGGPIVNGKKKGPPPSKNSGPQPTRHVEYRPKTWGGGPGQAPGQGGGGSSSGGNGGNNPGGGGGKKKKK